METSLDPDAVTEKNRIRMKAALLAEHRHNRSLPSELGTQSSLDVVSEAARWASASSSFSGASGAEAARPAMCALSSQAQLNVTRKRSCGDLVSRLKTRKLLGVGETSGEIHRSKISQLLGHSEHLFTRYPIGFWLWYRLLLVLYCLTGFWRLMMSPIMVTYLWSSQVFNQQDHSNQYDSQLTGVLYLCLASLLSNFYQSHDKLLVRFLINKLSLIALLRIIVILYNFKQNYITSLLACFMKLESKHTEMSTSVWLDMCVDMLTLSGNLYYQHRMSQPSYLHACAHTQSDESTQQAHNPPRPSLAGGTEEAGHQHSHTSIHTWWLQFKTLFTGHTRTN